MTECSPLSRAGSTFREIDLEFLQTQAKIWIEQILEKRFEEEDHLADLLADGEILFKVAKKISGLMQRKFGALIESPKFTAATSFGNSGKYLPYSNVDVFLKVCQRLGLTGIDLCSPSDVVERRDIRRVCMCIRALSKKARTKRLEVQDFDVVTHSVTMPSEMVNSIRNYLENARCAISSEDDYCFFSEEKDVSGKDNGVLSGDSFQTSHEDSDEAESILRLPEGYSQGLLLERNTDSAISVCSTCPRSPESTDKGCWFSEGSSPARNSSVDLNVDAIKEEWIKALNADDCDAVAETIDRGITTVTSQSISCKVHPYQLDSGYDSSCDINEEIAEEKCCEFQLAETLKENPDVLQTGDGSSDQPSLNSHELPCVEISENVDNSLQTENENRDSLEASEAQKASDVGKSKKNLWKPVLAGGVAILGSLVYLMQSKNQFKRELASSDARSHSNLPENTNKDGGILSGIFSQGSKSGSNSSTQVNHEKKYRGDKLKL